MIALLCFFLTLLVSPFKSKSRLGAQNAVLRREVIILRRKVRGRVHLTNGDRFFFVQLYRWFPSVLNIITIIRPETLVRWHRAGFRRYWRWKSRSLGGRPQVEADLRALIRRMSVDNPLWGAPRIHGELLKLGFEVAQSSVAKYMVKRPGPLSQGWRTFLRNHAPDIAAMDLFVAPTLGFDLLYAFIIVRLARRDLVWINVTPHPTADWIARQITEAFPWNEAPRYLIRDRDRVYGAAAMRRLRAMGIRDKPIASGSPWQNGFAESWHWRLPKKPGRDRDNRCCGSAKQRHGATLRNSLKQRSAHPMRPLSLGVHHQRIDVDLSQLGNSLHQPFNRHDHLRDRLDVRWRRAAETVEQLGRAQLVQRLDDLRFVRIDWQKLHVAQRLDPDAPTPSSSTRCSARAAKALARCHCIISSGGIGPHRFAASGVFGQVFGRCGLSRCQGRGSK
jgi:hypothetical protein